MRIMKLALTAVFAVLAFSAMVASSASAFHPLFLTESKAELLFSGEGGLALLRGLRTEGVLAVVDCEKSLTHGFASNLSTLSHRVVVTFEGKCLQTIPSTGEDAKCSEPIKTKTLLAELGLLSKTKEVAIKLAPSDGTKEFAKFTCGLFGESTVSGEIVGIIPEINAVRENQYNEDRSTIEVVFKSANKTENQEYTSILLLGVEDTKVELMATGFFTVNKASEEASGLLKGDGKIGIQTLGQT